MSTQRQVAATAKWAESAMAASPISEHAAVQEKERGKVQVTSVRLEERNGMHITVPVQIAKYRQGTKGTATFFSSD